MQTFAIRLLDWFDRHGRKNLPWQVDISPYRVWVSEIMLQQTRVSAVIPYFERFMARFPSLGHLARAGEDEVLHQWTGLGYYARARNLHAAARQVMREHHGELPATRALLETLPGIGRSTAAAIAAICTGERAAILDGNVKRVLARFFAIDGWPGESATLNRLWEKAEALTPESRVADYTQAIMDLGATVCTRTSPRCRTCPLAFGCAALKTNRINLFPGRKPRKSLPVRTTIMLLIEFAGEVLLEQRPPTGLWGGLYSLPECSDAAERLDSLGLVAEARQELPSFRHSFTHFHLDIAPVRILAAARPAGVSEHSRLRWYDPADPDEIGLTKPTVRLLGEARGRFGATGAGATRMRQG